MSVNKHQIDLAPYLLELRDDLQSGASFEFGRERRRFDKLNSVIRSLELATLQPLAAENETGGNTELIPLTDSQQERWDALDGRAKTAKQLRSKLDKNSDDPIRQLVQAVKKTGRKIEHRNKVGYWRPDSPPE